MIERPWASKRPGEVLDYELDWTPEMDSGETISTFVWSVEPAGLTLGNQVRVGVRLQIWLSGGTAEVTYRLLSRITTSAGRTLEAVVPIFVGG